jgi:DeoR family transcriptional regulator, fructose operon transcriptional repressor
MMDKDQLFAEERQLAILDHLRHTSKVTVGDLTARFRVSSATIRNDLRILEQQKLLLRTHGGAIPATKARFELASKESEVSSLPAKRRIAECALEFIDDGDTIILDTGSTTLELARLLHRRNDLTVVTNDLKIAALLEETPTTAVVVVGGRLRRGFHCTVGASGSEMLTMLTVDKAFVGANGFSPETGAGTPDLQQAEMKRALIAIANRVILLIDSSKIGRSSFVQFADLEAIDYLVTEELSDTLKAALEEREIEVRIAAQKPQ